MEVGWSVFHKYDPLAAMFHFHREAVVKTYKQLLNSTVSITQIPMFDESISQAMEVCCNSSIVSSSSRLPHIFQVDAELLSKVSQMQDAAVHFPFPLDYPD